MLKALALLLLTGACPTLNGQSEVIWGQPTAHPWRIDSQESWIVTADPFGFELARIYYLASYEAMRIGRRIVGDVALLEDMDNGLREVIECARGEAGAPEFRSVVLRTRWSSGPRGLVANDQLARRARRFLRLCQSLWGDTELGGTGWLARTGDQHPIAFAEGLLPRVPDPLAFTSTDQAPPALVLKRGRALSDPLAALDSVSALAARCQVFGGRTSARARAWRCVEVMAHWDWGRADAAYTTLAEVRAESALALALDLRNTEQASIVFGVPGGRSSVRAVLHDIAISAEEMQCLTSWLDRLEGCLEQIHALVDESERLGVKIAQARARSLRAALGAAKALKAAVSAPGVEPSVESVEGYISHISEYMFNSMHYEGVTGSFSGREALPDAASDCWLTGTYRSEKLTAFKWLKEVNAPAMCGGAPRLFVVDEFGESRELWD